MQNPTGTMQNPTGTMQNSPASSASEAEPNGDGAELVIYIYKADSNSKNIMYGNSKALPAIFILLFRNDRLKISDSK